MGQVKHVKSRPASRQGVQSVEMTLKVLLAVAEGSGSRALKDICGGGGLARHSAHRHLITLVRTGMVSRRSATGRYDLGTRVMELGLKALSRRDAIRIAGESLTNCVISLVIAYSWQSGPTMVRRSFDGKKARSP